MLGGNIKIKIPYPQMKANMTVVTATQCDGYLILAADSLVLDEGLRHFCTKLERSDNSPVVWGFAGELGIGIECSRLLKERLSEGISDWYQLRDYACNIVASVNGDNRNRPSTARDRSLTS